MIKKTGWRSKKEVQMPDQTCASNITLAHLCEIGKAQKASLFTMGTNGDAKTDRSNGSVDDGE